MKLGLKWVSLLALMLLVTYCKKDSTPLDEQEEVMEIAVDPDPGSGFAKAIGPTYDFNLLIKSKMPTGGVSIKVTFKRIQMDWRFFHKKLKHQVLK